MSKEGNFPFIRGRRLRTSGALRKLVSESRLHPADFIAPLFVMEGKDMKEEISSMPGYYRYTPDLLLTEISELIYAGIQSVLLFVKVPDEKNDNQGTEALNPDGLMQTTVREIKNHFPSLVVMTDVALDPY